MHSRWRGGGAQRDAPPQPGSSPRYVIRVRGSAVPSRRFPSVASWFAGCTPAPLGRGRRESRACAVLAPQPAGHSAPGAPCWLCGQVGAPGDVVARRHREREPRAALLRPGPQVIGGAVAGGCVRRRSAAVPLSQVAPGRGRPPPAAGSRPWVWESACRRAPAAALKP